LAARKTAKKKPSRRKQVEPESRGLEPAEVADASPPQALRELTSRIEQAGGRLLTAYRDPLGGTWLAIAALPLARIGPTPFQRDLSEAHARRMTEVIEKVGIFLDPVVAVAAPERAEVPFWSPNGAHRLSALRRLGARSVTAIVCPDFALAYRILALNTEKAHGTRERALEAMRMATSLAEIDPGSRESEFALELEDGSLVTLGFAYDAQPRFAGGAYAPALKASDALLDRPLPEVLELRRARAERLLAIDECVTGIVSQLKERGFGSPYLRNFVVSRIRPFRPRGKPPPGADELLDHMQAAAERFDVAKVRVEQVARSAGGGE
jgi:ParB family chromosome partitioning protein